MQAAFLCLSRREFLWRVPRFVTSTPSPPTGDCQGLCPVIGRLRPTHCLKRALSRSQFEACAASEVLSLDAEVHGTSKPSDERPPDTRYRHASQLAGCRLLRPNQSSAEARRYETTIRRLARSHLQPRCDVMRSRSSALLSCDSATEASSRRPRAVPVRLLRSCPCHLEWCCTSL